MGPHRSRFAPEQIHAPEAVFHVPQESQPGGTTRVLSRPVVTGANPANYVFVDLDVERQDDLLCDSRTAPVGITLFVSRIGQASELAQLLRSTAQPQTLTRHLTSLHNGEQMGGA